MSDKTGLSKRVEELTEKVQINELRARDAVARFAIVEAEMKLMSLREKMDHANRMDATEKNAVDTAELSES